MSVPIPAPGATILSPIVAGRDGEWAELRHRFGQAQAMFASHEAVQQLTRAIEAGKNLAHGAGHADREMGRLYRARAQSHENLGHFDDARADYEAALGATRANADARAEWESLLSLGFLWTGQDMAKARHYLDQARGAARLLGDRTALGASLNRIGNWRLNMEQSDEALRCHEEALATFAGLDDAPGVALTHDLLGITHMIRGDYPASIARHDRAIELFRQTDDRMSLASALATASLRGGCYQGDVCVFPDVSVEACWQLGAEAIQIARQIGWRSGEANANVFLALAMGARSAYARSLQCARDGLDIALDIGAIWEGVAHIFVANPDRAGPDPAKPAQAYGGAVPIRSRSGCGQQPGGGSAG